MVEANHSQNNAEGLQRKPDEKVSLVYRILRKWRPIVAVAVWLGVAASGGYSIWWLSSAFSDVAIAANFVVVNILSLSLLLVIIAQAFIYWGQRNIMQQSLERTDKMIDKMQLQLEAINKQEAHLSAQADAAQGQLTAIRFQADIMRQTLEQSQTMGSYTVEALDVTKGQLVAMQSQERAQYQTVETMQGQLVAMKEQSAVIEHSVESAELNSIYAQRAYVVAKIRDTGQYDDMFQFRLRIQNGGNTPANDVVVRYAFGLREKPPHEETPEGLIVSDAGFTETERLGLIAPNDSYHVITTEPPVPVPYPITTPEYKAWEKGWGSGTLKFYCWGRISYEDIFNNPRHTDFCFFQSQTRVNGYPCEHGNKAS